MVATRRGVRVCSPNKSNPEQSSEVQETPSTRRNRSRVTVKPAAESPTQHGAQEETSLTSSPLPSSPLPSSPTPSLKRCTRASRLHSPEQPCTPAVSVHEADASDAESCCSVVSMEIPMTRTRGRKKQTLSQGEISEVESCSSAVSGSRRSTRMKAVPPSSHTAPIEAEEEEDPNLGNESSSSVVSESTRVTRSQRKPARTRSSATKPPEDSEISDADSCLSSASAARSTTRRSTRTRRQTGPIPIHLEEASEGSRSPRSRRSLIPRGAVDVSEPPSCDSDGFESGPTSSMTTRRRLKTRSNASDSEPMEIHSPSKRTPSSRTTRSPAKDCSVILEKIEQGDVSLNDSSLENTVIAADCTVLEGEKSLVEEEKRVEAEDTAFITLSEAVEEDVTVAGEKAGVSITDVPLSEDKAVVVISDDDSTVTSPLISERQPEEAAVTVPSIIVESDAEQEVKDVLVKKIKVITVGGLFMIDTRPGQEVDELYYKEKNPHLKELSSRIDPGIRMKELGGLYINFDGGKSKHVSGSLQKLKEKKIQDEVMKKSAMGPDFEKNDAVPPYSESKKATKLKNRTEREKSTGAGWFNMKAPELTQELKADLQVLKMRGSMDSKRFYKKNDRDGFPKYFQVGTVVDSPIDFYHSRVPMKQRKRTMVEELLNDAEFRQSNKKKYQHIVTERAAKGAGRKNKKKSKFHKK
ncbi:hypothetical protein JOQ06_006105 [Pogonophryne albipinna]|uniref:Fcf2 pre-rRNA processing C-terminal domain-containing protein n=1 Tax=Pogonophryne albipinna TaxID=1090488 RepID=A0AAD6BF78_9TELE|nr:hypothetical protein JOQ06_006105 [Pogonophryne albipinna]